MATVLPANKPGGEMGSGFGLIESQGDKGQVYSISPEGYEAADGLRHRE